jgi:hypothetical protein
MTTDVQLACQGTVASAKRRPIGFESGHNGEDSRASHLERKFVTL